MKKLLILISILILSTTVVQAKKFPLNSLSTSYQFSNVIEKRKKSSHKMRIEFISNLFKQVKPHLGKTYEWGATGPYSFDCSGFTQAVFSKFNISLPRVSSAQARIGKLILKENLQTGDLVSFSSKSSNNVRHVGIYLGAGKFIHASSARNAVVISSLNSNYYSKHFKWGRRLILR